MKRTKIYNNVVDYRAIWDGLRVEDVTLPTLEHPTDTIAGEGMTADLDVANQSKVNSMELTIAHNNGVNCNHLKAPGIHTIEFRLARQRYDVPGRYMGHESDKYICDVQHKSTEEGSVERGNPLGSTEKYTVFMYKKIVDGELVDHVDASAGILKLDNEDCVEDISAILD